MSASAPSKVLVYWTKEKKWSVVTSSAVRGDSIMPGMRTMTKFVGKYYPCLIIAKGDPEAIAKAEEEFREFINPCLMEEAPGDVDMKVMAYAQGLSEEKISLNSRTAPVEQEKASLSEEKVSQKAKKVTVEQEKSRLSEEKVSPKTKIVLVEQEKAGLSEEIVSSIQTLNSKTVEPEKVPIDEENVTLNIFTESQSEKRFKKLEGEIKYLKEDVRYLRKKIRKLEENNTRQEEKANKENIRKATEKSTVKEKITENTRKEEKIVEISMPMTNEDNLSIEQEKYDESVVLDKFTDQDKLKYLVSCFFSNDDLKNCSRTGKRSCQVLNESEGHVHQGYNGNHMYLDSMVLGSPTGSMLPMDSDMHLGGPDMNYDMHMTVGERAITSSTGNDPKKKKGAGVVGKSIEEELCRICGDRASGYHYNALSCEGCKGFFRRSITRGASYHCKYGGNCEMDMWMRRKCQACRLRRCREVGMKEECLLSEEQCKARDVRRKQKSSKSKKHSESNSPESVVSKSDELTDSKEKVKANSCIRPETIIDPEPLLKCNEDTKTLVEKVVFLQDKYEFPDEAVIKSVNDVSADMVNSDAIAGDALLSQLAKMTVIITHLIVEFAKNLPGFSRISKDDQIVLLKAACSEVMAVRAARCYDLNTRTIVLANGTPCSLENMIAAGGSAEYWKQVFNFCHVLADYHTDNTEYALFTAICIFSDRHDLKNKEQVEQIQKIYIDALSEYLEKKRYHSGTCLARLLVRLGDLRSISIEHSKMLTMMHMDESLMPHIVQDIYIQNS